jgi:hypothetical protein
LLWAISLHGAHRALDGCHSFSVVISHPDSDAWVCDSIDDKFAVVGPERRRLTLNAPMNVSVKADCLRGKINGSRLEIARVDIADVAQTNILDVHADRRHSRCPPQQFQTDAQLQRVLASVSRVIVDGQLFPESLSVLA